jgi:hypothetical protein
MMDEVRSNSRAITPISIYTQFVASAQQFAQCEPVRHNMLNQWLMTQNAGRQRLDSLEPTLCLLGGGVFHTDIQCESFKSLVSRERQVVPYCYRKLATKGENALLMPI